MNGGAWWATVHGVAKSLTQLNRQHARTHACTAPLKAIAKGGQVFLVVMVTDPEEAMGSHNACGASHPLENRPVQMIAAALLRKRQLYLKT